MGKRGAQDKGLTWLSSSLTRNLTLNQAFKSKMWWFTLWTCVAPINRDPKVEQIYVSTTSVLHTFKDLHTHTCTRAESQLGLLFCVCCTGDVGDADPEGNAFTRYPHTPLSYVLYLPPTLFLGANALHFSSNSPLFLGFFFSFIVFQISFILNWNIPPSAFACVWLWPLLLLKSDWCCWTGTHATGVR